MNNDDDASSGWFMALSTRSALRAVTVFIGLAACYMAVAALGKHHLDPAFAHADALRALITFSSLDGLLVIFAICHASIPCEASEIDARISGRGVMRWLAMAGCFGCTLVGQVAAWWYHDAGLAFGSTANSGLVWLFFVVVYNIYAEQVKGDRIASKRSICANGTARDGLVKMAAITCLGFLLCGLAAASGSLLLVAIASCLATVVVFAMVNGLFVNNIVVDYDRG